MRFLYLILTLIFALNFNVSANSPTKMVTLVIILDNDGDDDQTTVHSLLVDFSTAEKVSTLLDVELTHSDETTDDVFIFALKTEDQLEMTMTLFDEEGYSIEGQQNLTLNNGQNYKALNVKTLDNGTYLFRLSDDDGNELTRSFKVQH